MQETLPIIEELNFVIPVVIPWGWIIAGTLLGLSLLTGVVLLTRSLLKKKRRRDELRAPERGAFQALETAFNQWRETGHLVYLEAVTTAIRIYLNGRFGLNAPTQTTTQLLKATETFPIFTTDQRNELRELLIRCDEIKFGSAATRETELKNLYKAACDFVKSTAWQMS